MLETCRLRLLAAYSYIDNHIQYTRRKKQMEVKCRLWRGRQGPAHAIKSWLCIVLQEPYGAIIGPPLL